MYSELILDIDFVSNSGKNLNKATVNTLLIFRINS